MDTLTPTEALVAMLAERPDIDATNAIPAFRAAVKRLAAELNPRFDEDMHTELESDYIDQIVIMASRNGRIDLFEV